MEELKLFQSPIFGQVRTVVVNGQVMFAATDVARCLGYTNPQKAIRVHCKSAGVNEMNTPTNGGIQKVKFITKGNLIRLVANSELPQAEEVESWIFDEVIPAVLETGGYIATKQDDTPEEIMARALTIAQVTLAKREERLKQLEAQAEQQQVVIEQKDKAITKLQPKADFADKAFAMEGKCDMGQAAKILKLGFGRNTLCKKLREIGVFFSNRNEPKQKYIDAGYFEMTEKPIPRKNHPGFIVMVVICTQKGLAYLNYLFGGNPSDGKLARIR